MSVEIPEIPEVPRVNTAEIYEDALARIGAMLNDEEKPSRHRHRQPKQEHRWWRWPKWWGATRDKVEQPEESTSDDVTPEQDTLL